MSEGKTAIRPQGEGAIKKFPQTKVVTTAKELKWRVDQWRVDTAEKLQKFEVSSDANYYFPCFELCNIMKECPIKRMLLEALKL